MKKRELEAARNNAEFWHSFAYLAVIGKRTVEQFAIAQLGGAKESYEVETIKGEAKQAQAERIAASQSAANWRTENAAHRITLALLHR